MKLKIMILTLLSVFLEVDIAFVNKELFLAIDVSRSVCICLTTFH